MSFKFVLLLLNTILVLISFPKCLTAKIVNFEHELIVLTKNELKAIQSLTQAEWLDFINNGIESYNQEKKLESNLIGSEVTVKNGSISQIQFLDSLPNEQASKDSEIANKILKASLYIYNTRCAPRGISGEHCEAILSNYELPENIQLGLECQSILQNRRDGHEPFRRLLQRHYRDGFHTMYSHDDLPQPLLISQQLSQNGKMEVFDESNRNLFVVQMSQFLHNDLSKPVVSVMNDGSSIECCNSMNFEIKPSQRHPACEPLIAKDPINNFAPYTCLNYVRSALAVRDRCKFGSPEQLNQATGQLDLSQLYGFTKESQRHMRTYSGGQLKSSKSDQTQLQLLPLATTNSQLFCAMQLNGTASNCFMAGDSRVNSDPLNIAMYTVFLRNHNRIADELKQQQLKLSDEQLFNTAKSINIKIYREIIFNELLPTVIGATLTNEIKSSAAQSNEQISNEFAVAASRFYLSMMPNILKLEQSTTNSAASGNSVGHNTLTLRGEFNKPNFQYTSAIIDNIIHAALLQNAMKMDSKYEKNFQFNIAENVRPTCSDLLALDVQRGRDHGLQPYVKYLEKCSGLKVQTWKDLQRFMSPENVQKLKAIYANITDVDLIVGGMLESSVNEAAVGQTFQCILSEQFSKLHRTMISNEVDMALQPPLRSITAADLLCLNSHLKQVPANVFQIVSDKNPLSSCSERLKTIL